MMTSFLAGLPLALLAIILVVLGINAEPLRRWPPYKRTKSLLCYFGAGICAILFVLMVVMLRDM